jgi:lambda repressor-like predicted transcriptional regulator
MSVSSISSTSYASRAMQALAGQRSQAQQNGGPLSVAAKALNLSTSDLATQLQDGKSLADVAEAQGVSRDDLTAALKAGMPADQASSANADDTIDSLIDQVGLPTGPPPPPPPPPSFTGSSTDSSVTGLLSDSPTQDQQNTLNSLSSLLDTDSQSLLKQLRTGTSLSDLVKNAGIDASTLASVVQDGLLFDTRA